MNFLGFGQSAEIDIIFDGAENRKTAEVKGEDGKVEKMLLYYDGETVSGKVNVTLKKPGSKLEHQGIKIEFIGQIELFYDRGNHHEFKCLAKALARPGDLIQNTSYPFDFPNVEKQFEVYAGSNVRLRYFLRATIVRRISDITKEVDVAVHTLCSYPEMNNPIKMEVGIEDCLHIEFEYNKSKYHLKDTIIGKIYFLLVRIKIKHMEIAIIKRESTGTGPNMFTENETIAKYEIMDGAPVKGESIPIRVFLAGYNLTPTMRDINKKFSVKYFLNLVLMDTEDRRYFKQQEITLWRKADIPRYHAQNQQHAGIGAGLPSHHHHHHPQHAPPHLVGGPAPMTAASHLGSGDTAVFDNDVGGVNAPAPTPIEGKMGLFTRESPNQEFHQESLPTSPTTPTAPTLTSGGVTGFTIERGMGDGAAAATNTSPVMLSTTPPPLTSNSDRDSSTGGGVNVLGGGAIVDDDDFLTEPLTPAKNKQISSMLLPHDDLLDDDDDDIANHGKNDDEAVAAIASTSDDDGLRNVPLTSSASSPTKESHTSPTPLGVETKKKSAEDAPLLMAD